MQAVDLDPANGTVDPPGGRRGAARETSQAGAAGTWFLSRAALGGGTDNLPGAGEAR